MKPKRNHCKCLKLNVFLDFLSPMGTFSVGIRPLFFIFEIVFNDLEVVKVGTSVALYKGKRNGGFMKNFFAILLMAVLGHHFLMTFLYVGPTNPYTENYQSYNRSYMEPLFTQNWGLFAPEPATNELKLWYRCQDTKKVYGWLDAISSLQKEHQNNRFTFRGKLSFIYTSLIRGLNNESIKIKAKCKKESCDKNEENKQIQSLEYYRSTKRLVSDLCEKKGLSISSFNIVIHSPKSYSERNNKNAKGKISFLSFR